MGFAVFPRSCTRPALTARWVIDPGRRHGHPPGLRVEQRAPRARSQARGSQALDSADHRDTADRRARAGQRRRPA